MYTSLSLELLSCVKCNYFCHRGLKNTQLFTSGIPNNKHVLVPITLCLLCVLLALNFKKSALFTRNMFMAFENI